MASVARFGFEGGKIPSNVSMYNNMEIVSGVGRQFGTNPAGYAARGGSDSVLFTPSNPSNGGNWPYDGTTLRGVKITSISTTEILCSLQIKIVYEGTGVRFKMFQFGQVSIWYEHGTKKFRFYTTDASTTTNIYVYQTGLVYGSPVYTSSALNIQTQKWLPINLRILLNSTTGVISLTVDGTNITFTGNTSAGSTIASDLYIYGGGELNNLSYNYYRGNWGYPTLLIDDIAVNNNISVSNSTGSYGVSDTSYPPYISCQLASYSSTGSNTVGWTSTTPLQSAMTQSGIYGTASFYPRPEMYLSPSNDFYSATTVEGINYYISGAYREGSSDVYIFPQFTSGSLSIQGMIGSKLATSELSSSLSVFEKDLGGKLSYSDYVNGNLTLKSSRWINKNFFGRGLLGDVRYSSNTNLGDSTDNGDYVIVEYNNLIIDSGVTVTTSARKKGLIIYVRENCIINGTLSMVGKAPVGLTNLTNGFIFSKNVSDSQFSESNSILYPQFTSTFEQLFQPYLISTSSRFDITTTYSIQGAPGQSADTPGEIRQCGGGGQGWVSLGSSSTSYGGGKGGTGNSAQYPVPGGDGGGIIYLIVGKTLYIGPTGVITCKGADALSGYSAGGGGGGAITMFYGLNFINSGSLLVGGGVSGYSGGYNGGNGSVRISKIITY